MAIIVPNPPGDKSMDVIRRMQRNKRKRYHYEISREKFLEEHSKLRAELAGTWAYIQLRKKVRERSGGICEKCRKAKAVQLAHKLPVAKYPELALKLDNVYDACIPCHQADHPQFKLTDVK